MKDYFGLRMSLISQVLAVVCRLEDLASHRLPHGEEDTPVGKHVSKQEAVRAFPATPAAPLLPGGGPAFTKPVRLGQPRALPALW